MKGIYIYPETINESEYSNEWAVFCTKFGYDLTNPPSYVLVVEIKTD